MATIPKHIRIDNKGRAWIAGTNTKVLEIVLDHIAHGLSAEEIHFQHYGTPSIAQIHAALAYYYENKTELDAEIAQQVKGVEKLRKQAGKSPIAKRLRAEGKLR